jgi:hypothetical protein
MVEHQDTWFSQSEIHFLMLSVNVKQGFWMSITYSRALRDHASSRDDG